MTGPVPRGQISALPPDGVQQCWGRAARALPHLPAAPEPAASQSLVPGAELPVPDQGQDPLLLVLLK